ncbi:hypothetical protein D3C86_2074010 [compost metagenome]
MANSLALYLKNHPEMECRIEKENKTSFFTSGDAQAFDAHASIFFGEPVLSNHVNLKA